MFPSGAAFIRDQDYGYGPRSARRIRSSNFNAISFDNVDNFVWALVVSASNSEHRVGLAVIDATELI